MPSDVDGPSLSYSLVGGADQGEFTIVALPDALPILAAPNFEAPGDAGGNNVYDVTVRASDGTLFDDQAIAVSVGNVNETPVIISDGGGATASIGVAENGTAVATVMASDVDGPSLSYSLVGGADQGKFTIDAATGLLSFPSAPLFESPGDAGGNNVYDVTVRASDGTLFDDQAIAVSVSNVNETPVITSDGGGATPSTALA